MQRDDSYHLQLKREIAVDNIMVFLGFGEFDLKTQTQVAELIGAEGETS